MRSPPETHSERGIWNSPDETQEGKEEPWDPVNEGRAQLEKLLELKVRKRDLDS